MAGEQNGRHTTGIEVELTKPGRGGREHAVRGVLYVTDHTGTEDVLEELFTAAVVDGWTLSLQRVQHGEEQDG